MVLLIHNNVVSKVDFFGLFGDEMPGQGIGEWHQRRRKTSKFKHCFRRIYKEEYSYNLLLMRAGAIIDGAVFYFCDGVW